MYMCVPAVLINLYLTSIFKLKFVCTGTCHFPSHECVKNEKQAEEKRNEIKKKFDELLTQLKDCSGKYYDKMYNYIYGSVILQL